MNQDPATAQETSLTPVLFELPLQVTAEDIDIMNHANNVVYLRWVQEVATAHWSAAATPQQQEEYAWVALRHEIDYLSPAFLDDALVARTHVGEASGARFERHVEIWRTRDNRLLARSRSVWAAIDPRTGRPRRVNEELRRQFFVDASLSELRV